MLNGYPLRKYTWKDWLLMIFTSSLVLQIVVAIGASFLVDIDLSGLDSETVRMMTEQEVLRLSINSTVYGTIISLPLVLLAIHWRKIPLINRRHLSRNESFLIRGLNKEDWKFLLRYIPISYVLYTIGSVIVAYFFGATEAANQVAVESLFDYVPMWIMFVMIVIVAPIAEELLFRGIVLFPGDRRETTWIRVITSAILFGLVHGPTDVYSLYTYVGMGFIFGYASKRTQTVEAAMVYHFLNNLMGFLVIYGQYI